MMKCSLRGAQKEISGSFSFYNQNVEKKCWGSELPFYSTKKRNVCFVMSGNFTPAQ